jgi:hypothetical protein
VTDLEGTSGANQHRASSPLIVASRVPLWDPLLILDRLSREYCVPVSLQGVRPIEATEKLDGRGNVTSPPGLVSGTQPGTVIPVEVFIEQHAVLPAGIGLELLHAAVHWPSRVSIPQEDAGEVRRVAISGATSNRFINRPSRSGTRP